MMKKNAFPIAFALGAVAVVWVSASVAGSHLLVLLMTTVIGAVYAYGALELRHYRTTTAQLEQALAKVPAGLQALEDWLITVPAALRHAVRQRIEGERSALPGPALTPYLVGLLVMLGMLGTFLGMVVTLNGAVFALEGTTSVQGMRAAFSEPIKGLGLAFGTSVAGVATSAMLGLMSSLCRRERAGASQQLDELMAVQLRPFSLAHQRQETFKALQQQSQVVQQLQALMTQMEHHSQQLGARVLEGQDRFHGEVKAVYGELARSVDASMRSSLSQSMQIASDSIRPVVQATLAEMAEQAQTMHQRLYDTMGERTQTLLTGVHHTLTEQHGLQTRADQERLDAWKASLESTADTLQTQWQASGQQTLVQIERLMAGNDALMHARTAAEAQWAAQHNQRSEELAALLRDELSALREQEAQRAEAAVARLSELQTAVAGHLTALGTALEDPIARLIETASEAPRAAAQVIGQLRQEISVSVARDNALLEERARMLETLNTLLDAINHAASEQRGVIDALVASTRQTLSQASSEFHQHVSTETGKLGDIAAQVTASAVDVASLGETFGFAVRHFNETHEKLIASLERMEAAIGQSMTRSDEQLAYYVAQAREIVDLSISSQKDVLEALQQRQTQGAA
ncbi:MAG: hypothetical protein ACKOWC_04875 [Limnohabitans sp.]